MSYPHYGLRAETCDKIAEELKRARAKFPGNKKLLAALFEEGGELARALLQRAPRSEIEKEAIQVAAVAIRILEEGDADFDGTEWSAEP